MFTHTIAWGGNKPPEGSQINWGHPLSRGLVGCWLMNETGNFYSSNLVHPGHRAIMTNCTRKNAPNNAVSLISFNGTSSKIACSPIISNLHNSRMMINIYTKLSIQGSARRILSNALDANNLVQILQYGSLEFIVLSGGTYLVRRDIETPNYTNYHLFTFIWNGTTAFIYVDGIRKDNINTTNTYGEGTTGTLWLGTRGADAFYSGNIGFVYIHIGMFNAAHACALVESPYQFISAPRRRFYSFPIEEQPGITAGIMTPRSSYWGDL